ncbi:MAG: D-alanyl-D-alanine carboxypeptidase [Rhizobiaceae bacterium]|nr:D-alanyl-D-alanine carboxypeptidase [Rhizobiaceae bacterium]
MVFSVLAGGAKAETTVVVDVASGKVLSEKNASARWYPASTTKLMTTYLALKALETGDAALDTPVVMTRFAASQAPSKMGFEPGSVMRLDMALRMILVKSANDVSVAIGQALGGGSIETFVAKMNTEAAALGMKDTWFINPNGLPGPGQYSSAKDLAILGTRLRRDFPAFSEIFGVEAIQAGSQLMRNTNGLIGRYAGADGMKTGYICASGFNVVASATREGRTLVAVVLGADGPIVRDRITAEILEKGFATDAAGIATTVEALPVSSGPPADISKAICSPEGQKARAEERQLETKRGENSGSPFLTKMTRPPSIVAVGLGGAAGSATVEPGISQIAAYGIPLPRWRPDPADTDDAKLREETGNVVDGAKDETGKGVDEKTGRATIAGAALGSADMRGGVVN